MFPYICEFVGTALLLLLGNGVVANVSLTKSNFKGGGLLMITTGWGLAVMIPAYIFGAYSGAHFNPALTIGLAVGGLFPWHMVPGYCIAQFLGGFVGGSLTWLLFKDQFAATEDHATKLGVFCTSPAIRNIPQNLLSEIIGTAVLLFAIMGISTSAGLHPAPGQGLAVGMNYIFVFGIIVSVGQSIGGLTGYAINPARDWGPRMAHTLMPIPNKGSSHWGDYAFVPLVGPIIGGIIGVLLYQLVFSFAGM